MMRRKGRGLVCEIQPLCIGGCWTFMPQLIRCETREAGTRRMTHRKKVTK